MSKKPEIVVINHDDYHAKHIGRMPDGCQFFLTAPFVPGSNISEGSEYIADFRFSAGGTFLHATIDRLGPRGSFLVDDAQKLYQKRLLELGEVEFCRIGVKPFATEIDGVSFGLIPREPEGDDGIWAVELQPGNYMAFFEPWDSGEYDT